MDGESLQSIVGELRQLGSDTARVEAKRTTRKIGDSIWATVSAFSNTAGGIIILGLDEANGFSTSPDFDASQIIDQLKAGLRGPSAKVLPQPSATLDQFVFEGNQVVVLEIAELPAAQKPCFVVSRGKENGSFGRMGDGDHKLGTHEVYLLSNIENVSREDYAPVENAKMDDLDPVLVRKLIDRVSSRRPRAVVGTSGQTEILRRLQVLATDTEHPTLAGLLSVGKYPQQFFGQLMISFAAYPGKSKEDMTQGTGLVDSAVLEGAIPDMVDDTVKVVLRNLRHRRVMRGAGAEEVPEIPVEALREAVVNAVTHRDYSSYAQGDQVRVELYSDRLEVYSPGGIWGRRIESIDNGMSRSRNQVLSKLLTDVEFRDRSESVCENQGSGIPRMRGVMQQSGLPAPGFRSSIAQFVVTLSRYGLLNPDMLRWLADLPGGERSNLEDQTLALLHHLDSASLDELRLQLGVDTSEQQVALQRMERLGLVGYSPSEGRYFLQVHAQTNLSELERAVVDLLEKRSELNVRQISVETRRSVSHLRPVLRRMVDNGLIAPTAPATSKHRAYRLAQ